MFELLLVKNDLADDDNLLLCRLILDELLIS